LAISISYYITSNDDFSYLHGNTFQMEYKAQQGIVVYRSRYYATSKLNFQIMPGAAWLKLLLQHVPDRGDHRVRYYGW